MKFLVFLLALLSSVIVSELALGSRKPIIVSKSDYSMQLPHGWNVKNGAKRISLLLEAPQSRSGGYRDNIQVLTFAGQRPIDRFTKAQFAALIEQKFSSLVGRRGYIKVKKSKLVKLNNGNPAILFRSEVRINKRLFGQIHLLASSRHRHYLVSYSSAVAKGKKRSYWNLMAKRLLTFHPSSQAASRFENVLFAMGIIVTLVCGLLLLMTSLRRASARRDQTAVDQLEDEFWGVSETERPNLNLS